MLIHDLSFLNEDEQQGHQEPRTASSSETSLPISWSGLDAEGQIVRRTSYRVYTMILFGIINYTYTWYDPKGVIGPNSPIWRSNCSCMASRQMRPRNRRRETGARRFSRGVGMPPAQRSTLIPASPLTRSANDGLDGDRRCLTAADAQRGDAALQIPRFQRMLHRRRATARLWRRSDGRARRRRH